MAETNIASCHPRSVRTASNSSREHPQLDGARHWSDEAVECGEKYVVPQVGYSENPAELQTRFERGGPQAAQSPRDSRREHDRRDLAGTSAHILVRAIRP